LLDNNMNQPKVGLEELLFCRINGAQKLGFRRLPAHGATEPLLNGHGSILRVSNPCVKTIFSAFCPY